MTAHRDRLVAAQVAAATYYRRTLESPAGSGPRTYLASRHLEQCLDDPRWIVGYAATSWTAALTHLRERGFADTEIVASGLATAARTGNMIDRFRDRLMIGIRDATGDLVGFTARAAPGARREAPRYLNSPLTEIFKKRELLFGLAEQSERLAAGATPVIVEGSFDVLATAQVTTKFAAMSTCGTALTMAQVSALRHAATQDTVLVAYDADPAGRKAAMAAYHLLAGYFDRIRVAYLPEGHDPASCAEGAPEDLCRALTESNPLADALTDHAISQHPDHADNAEARVNALHEATRAIANLSPTDVARQVGRTARRLRLNHSAVSQDLAEVLTRGPLLSTGRRSADPPRATTPGLAEARVGSRP